MSRDRRFTRVQRVKHIRRKQRIIKEQGNYWHYEHAGSLSKGKIHCSCPMCRRKSYDSPKIQDVRSLEKGYDEMSEEDIKSLRHLIKE